MDKQQVEVPLGGGDVALVACLKRTTEDLSDNTEWHFQHCIEKTCKGVERVLAKRVAKKPRRGDDESWNGGFYSRSKNPEARALSNFEQKPVTVGLPGQDTEEYPSAEAAFHACKFESAAQTPGLSAERRANIKAYAATFSVKTPSEARKAGGKGKFPLSVDEMRAWDSRVAQQVQEAICRAKARDPAIAELLRTHRAAGGSFFHQERFAKANSPWGCRFVDGVQVGQNRLGKLWDLVADALEKPD